MKAILVAVVIVAVMALLGWITFSWVGDRPTVTANPEVIEHDLESSVDATRNAANRAIDEVKRTDVDVDVTREPDSP